MSTTIERYEAGLTALVDLAKNPQVAGPEWLQTIRARGLAAHENIGVPNPKHEEWKYTPLRSLLEANFTPSEPGPAVFDTELPRYEEGSVRIVLVNGRFDRNLSDGPTVKGLSVHPLYNALIERPDAVEPYLGKIARFEKHTFAALNTAAFLDGVFIHISEGAAIEPLIEIVHLGTGDKQTSLPRLLIVAEQASTAKIVETYVTEGNVTHLTIPVCEVSIAKHANIEHVRVQDEAESTYHIGLWETRQAGDSEYRSYNVAFGGHVARLDQAIDLQGEHCTTRLDGVVVATGNQLIDNHTSLDHALPNCNSFEVYKQVVGDSATVVFNGKIFVHPHAQKTDAKQTNQALLLSPTATINSKPQLEIFADDVKCTHGATVGQLEDLPLFYMRQRGVPKALAQSLLVYAFAAEVLELISIDSVKTTLEARLFSKLGTDPTA